MFALDNHAQTDDKVQAMTTAQFEKRLSAAGLDDQFWHKVRALKQTIDAPDKGKQAYWIIRKEFEQVVSNIVASDKQASSARRKRAPRSNAPAASPSSPQ